LCLSSGIDSRWRRTMHRRSSECRPNCDLERVIARMRNGIRDCDGKSHDCIEKE
jgi:hypothetical protein